jgi:UDP-N-acetylmuramate dehydrogenase
MQIQENISLKAYNTFGIEVRASHFAHFKSAEELAELLREGRALPALVLGGGSNLLFTKDVEGLVIKNEIRGIRKVKEDEDFVYVQVGAGENWHGFVLHCIANGWAGVENLALIPGNVGASPMQNIGAYGVEIKDVFHELKAYHIEEKANYTFGLKECEFGYRESVFKRKYRGQFVIVDVSFRLRKKPVFNTSYGAIEQELERMGIRELSIEAIANAVINIRSSKLPDPTVTGNAGSFFKNPEINAEQFLNLQQKFPSIVSFALPNGHFKLAAGWMIEQCGWKGVRRGDAGCHPKQALVLVNYGNASGMDIYRLSEEIEQCVVNQFGVRLEREVNII